MSAAVAPDYRVALGAFSGPLDLLLYLVKRHEVDVRDIPVAEVARQFQEYVAALQQIDIEFAGEFLVMAATLLEIKSKLLLPTDGPAPEEEADPRQELVKQLVEYRKYREAARLLEGRAERQSARLARQPPPAAPRAAEPPPLRPVELWDLVSAFGRLLRETLTLGPRQIVADETPLPVYLAFIRRRLEEEPRLPFRALFGPPYTRARLVGLFLGVLELIKEQVVRVEQPEPFGEIWVVALPIPAPPTASAAASAASSQPPTANSDSSPPPPRPD